MDVVNVFIDTSTANRIAELDNRIASRLNKRITSDPTYIEDKCYLRKIVKDFVVKGLVRLYWNPWVKSQIENTRADWKRSAVLRKIQDCSFTDYQLAIFPLDWSEGTAVTFVSEKQGKILDDIYNDLPNGYLRDNKILADALFNQDIEFLLTTDRAHLANERLRSKLDAKGLTKLLTICTPRELFQELEERNITIG